MAPHHRHSKETVLSNKFSTFTSIGKYSYTNATINVTFKEVEMCRGSCLASSRCTQPCALPFRGEIGFLCRQKRWRKSTETCTSLSVEMLFKDLNSTARLSLAASSIPLPMLGLHTPQPTPESVALGIRRNCPLDFACIIDAVRLSEVTAGNIAFIVELLRNISAELSDNVTREKMKSLSMVANHILDTAAISNWTFVSNKGAGWDLLESVNLFAGQLRVHKEAEDFADEPFIQTKGFQIGHNTSQRRFHCTMSTNLSAGRLLGMVEFPRQELHRLPGVYQAITVAFPTLGAILNQAHTSNGSLSRPINGLVLSVILPEELKEILLTFEKINKTQDAKAHCVVWRSVNRTWDESVCETAREAWDRVTCRCGYTSVMTSFSILMSPRSLEDRVLDYITCVGLSVSILSLVLCLVVEAVVWPRVVGTEIAHVRHVCLVNMAVSLLAADVCFMVGSVFNRKARDHEWCVAVTFLSHFSYLSLFFWMLCKALLIVYGILVVFHRMLKSHLMAIGFAVGYGCPLIIATTTVAVTEPGNGYVRTGACWLAWDGSKALFAFAIPALVIVAVNLLAVLVVAVNTQRPSMGSSKSQDVAIVTRISKNVAVLTPLLGLTWGFGTATLIRDTSLTFHIIFALLNAFQGFFILLFGTILDHKIRDALRMRVSSLKGRPRAAENASCSPTSGPKLVHW
ncbi:adhesion G protein-coupled receptor F4 [Ctenodactylus gundi]